MGLGRYMVDAVVLEGRKPSELAKAHGISQSLDLQARRSFPEGWLSGSRAPLAPSPLEPSTGQPRGPGGGGGVAPRAVRGRP